jgi:hypothetical protein
VGLNRLNRVTDSVAGGQRSLHLLAESVLTGRVVRNHQPKVISTSKLKGASSLMWVILVEQLTRDVPIEVTVFFTLGL